MLQKILRNKVKLVLIILFILTLVSIRAFESVLFYDPFLVYFQNDYLTKPYPKFEAFEMFFGLFLRYFLNTVISLALIYVIFKDWALTKFALVLYLIFFFIFIAALFILIYFSKEEYNFILFYVRRFLIQPILLLLFIPAFFYQKNTK